MPRGQSGAGPAKGVNLSGSKNNVRFQKMSHRVKRARVAARAAPRGANVYDIGDSAKPTDLIADFDVQGAAGTFFRDTLKHWSDRNLTSEYVQFQRQVYGKVQTLPQLLHHLPDVVEACLIHLAVKSKEAARPILALIAAIAQDVGKDLIPHMQHIVTTMLELVDPADPEFMGATITSLSLLFKHLSKHLVTELESVCNWCSPLIAHHKRYVREFVAESLAFLLRKLKGKQLRKHVRGLILSTDATMSTSEEKEGEQEGFTNDTIDGIATLLFEVVKNVQNQFHSQTDSVLRAMFRCLGHHSPIFNTSNNTTILSEVTTIKGKIVLKGLHLMMEHTRASHANVVWEELFRAIQYYSSTADVKSSKNGKNGTSSSQKQDTLRMEGLSCTLRCLAQCARHRYGTRVMRGSQNSGSMHTVLSNVLEQCSKGESASWMPRLFDANLHVVEGTWVVISHEDDDERTTERMRDLHRRCHTVVSHNNQAKTSFVQHLKRMLSSIDIRPFMLRGVIHVIVDACDHVLCRVDPHCAFSLLLNVHVAVQNATSNVLRSASARLTAHKRLRVSHRKEENDDGVLDALVHALENALESAEKNEGNSKQERTERAWSAMKCARVVHDPSGRVRNAMDALSIRLRNKIMQGEAEEEVVDVEDVEEEKKKKKKKKKTKTKKRKSTVEEEEDAVSAKASEASVSMDKETRDVMTFLASECLRAQLALRIGDHHDDGWYEQELSSVVEWSTSNVDRIHNVSVLQTLAEFLKRVRERDIGRDDEEADDDDNDHQLTTATSTQRSSSAILDAIPINTLLERLEDNLQSPLHSIRLHTLEILSVLRPLSYETKKNEANNTTLSGACDVLNLLCRFEALPLTLQVERERESILRNVQIYLKSGVFPIRYKPTVAKYLYGTFHIKFSRTWETARELLTTLATSGGGFHVVWKGALEQLSALAAYASTEEAAEIRRGKKLYKVKKGRVGKRKNQKKKKKKGSLTKEQVERAKGMIQRVEDKKEEEE